MYNKSNLQQRLNVITYKLNNGLFANDNELVLLVNEKHDLITQLNLPDNYWLRSLEF